jgi:hypothetical protein
MKLMPLLIALLTVAPAAAQSRVYTNADLMPNPVTAWTRTVTPARLSPTEAAAILAPYRFQAPPPRALEAGPWMVVLHSSPTAGPFGEFAPFPAPVRLDGTSYLDPPWEQRAYVGRSYGSGRTADARPSPAPNSSTRGSHRRR